MKNYQCITCGKIFDPERNEICPSCGAAVAPSAMTRVERRRTAVRLRAEGMTDYDDHCHEDDAWKDSYGAYKHRAAVRAHEEELRAGYAAHSSDDVTTRGTNPIRVSNANQRYRTASSGKGKKSFNDRVQKTPALLLLIFFLPAIIIFFVMLISMLLQLISGIGDLGSFLQP